MSREVARLPSADEGGPGRKEKERKGISHEPNPPGIAHSGRGKRERRPHLPANREKSAENQ